MPYDFAPLLRMALLGTVLALGPLAWIWLRHRGSDADLRLRALTVLTLFLTFDLVLFGAFTRLTDLVVRRALRAPGHRAHQDSGLICGHPEVSVLGAGRAGRLARTGWIGLLTIAGIHVGALVLLVIAAYWGVFPAVL